MTVSTRAVLRSSLLAIASLVPGGRASAASAITGQVLGAGAPIASATVTMWAAGTGDPKRVSQTRTGSDGRFSLARTWTVGDSSFYLVAAGGHSTASRTSGDNPAIALLTVVGADPPPKVVINEM